jgi:hypothetical protein
LQKRDSAVDNRVCQLLPNHIVRQIRVRNICVKCPPLIFPYAHDSIYSAVEHAVRYGWALWVFPTKDGVKAWHIDAKIYCELASLTGIPAAALYIDEPPYFVERPCVSKGALFEAKSLEMWLYPTLEDLAQSSLQRWNCPLH